jgi:AcrR family transcriptional regulator
MVTTIPKRPRGRPKGFIPDEALDRAVEMFWEYGYEGVDVDRIARAVNVTKPALYRAFGDKSTLLLRAVERYTLTYVAVRMAAFQAEPDIHKAVTTFCDATVNAASNVARGGCMLAAAALGHSKRVAEIHLYVANGFTATADDFAKRFEKETKAERLSRKPIPRCERVCSLTYCRVCSFAPGLASRANNSLRKPEAMCP